MSCGVSCTKCNFTSSGVPFCACDLPWSNVGDLSRTVYLDCVINFEASKILHIVAVILWALVLVITLFAILKLHRSTPKMEIQERLSLYLFLVMSSCLISCHVLESLANTPGERSIGVDLTTSILFYVGISLFFVFMFALLLIKSGTTVIPFALLNVGAKNRNKMVVHFVIISSTISCVIFSITIIMVFFPAYSFLLLQILYVCFSFFSVSIRSLTQFTFSPRYQ